MRHLTVRQPWAGLIALGIKDVENRTWRAPDSVIGERIAVHAGRWDREYDDLRTAQFNLAAELGIDVDTHPALHTHGIVVATVRIDDVIDDSPSAWAHDGWWHWQLADVRRRDVRRATPLRGRVGLGTPAAH